MKTKGRVGAYPYPGYVPCLWCNSCTPGEQFSQTGHLAEGYVGPFSPVDARGRHCALPRAQPLPAYGGGRLRGRPAASVLVSVGGPAASHRGPCQPPQRFDVRQRRNSPLPERTVDIAAAGSPPGDDMGQRVGLAVSRAVLDCPLRMRY